MVDGNGATDQDTEIAEGRSPLSGDGEKMARDSSSSDSDVSGEDEDELNVRNLEQAIWDNPNNYDARIKYIKCLRKAGEIEKLRAARVSMNTVFPLSPTMWQE